MNTMQENLKKAAELAGKINTHFSFAEWYVGTVVLVEKKKSTVDKPKWTIHGKYNQFKLIYFAGSESGLSPFVKVFYKDHEVGCIPNTSFDKAETLRRNISDIKTPFMALALYKDIHFNHNKSFFGKRYGQSV